MNYIISKNIRIKTIDVIKKNTNIKIRKLKINIAIINRTIETIYSTIINEIVKLLHNIGMRDNLVGYHCFIDCILYTLTYNRELDKKYMYHVYEKEKNKYKKNIHSIERDMRYAKEATWQYKSHLYIEKILGYSFNYKHSIPTNMELLLILTECVRITIGY